MLIIDMPMPKNCEQCPLAERVYSDCENFKLYCLAGEERKEIITLGIPVWCPIKGALPDEHGDLIDRDELRKMNVFSQEFNRYVVPMMYIEDANPIVAAERKDDEQIH